MGVILESLGIYGIPDNVENAILTCMLSGDPGLMIGPPGTAKTESIDMIGAALKEASKRKHLPKYKTEMEAWLKNNKQGPEPKLNLFEHQVYDASKLNFEDLVGIINIDAMSKGKIEYISTPTTIWGKKLVAFDEFNRIDPDRQSNLMEIIRSRRCMGVNTGTLFIMNAMNPFGDAGTQILSEALVDRHAMFIQFPDFAQMDQDDRLKIINRVGNSDAVGYKAWSQTKQTFDVSSNAEVVNDTLADAGEKLIALITQAMKISEEIKSEYSKKIAYLVSRTFESLNSVLSGTDSEQKGALLSGRRAGLCHRTIILYRAMEIAKSQIYNTPLDTLITSILRSYPMTMPFGVSGNLDVDKTNNLRRKLMEDIRLHWPQIESGDNIKLSDTLFELFGSASIYRKIEILLNNEIPETISNSAWNLVLTAASQKKINIELIISYLVTIDENIVPNNIKGRLNFGKVGNENPLAMSTSLLGPLAEMSQKFETLIGMWKQEPIIQFFIVGSLREYENKTVPQHEAVRIFDSIAESAGNINNLIESKKKAILKNEDAAIS